MIIVYETPVAVAHCIAGICRALGELSGDVLRTEPKRGDMLVADDSAPVTRVVPGDVVEVGPAYVIKPGKPSA